MISGLLVGAPLARAVVDSEKPNWVSPVADPQSPSQKTNSALPRLIPVESARPRMTQTRPSLGAPIAMSAIASLLR